MWIWAVIGAVLGLLLYIGEMGKATPAKRETTVVGWRELEDWDSMDQLEELDEEE